jgi:hypothetical protein
VTDRFSDEADPDEGGPDPNPDAPTVEFEDVDPEVPEADALDQHRSVVEERATATPRTIPADVPEADALDQSRPAPVDDDRRDD